MFELFDTYFFTCILLGALIYLSYKDLQEYRLPDHATFPLALIGLFQFYWLQSSIMPSLLGLAFGYGIFVIISYLFKSFKGKDGLGRGDAKLLAAGGAWCGVSALPFIILIASTTGLVSILFPSMKKKALAGYIPFGPFLAFGIGVTWLTINLTQRLDTFTLNNLF